MFGGVYVYRASLRFNALRLRRKVWTHISLDEISYMFAQIIGVARSAEQRS
jgi:hypothetical protein